VTPTARRANVKVSVRGMTHGQTMISARARLEVAYLWRRHLLDYRLLAARDAVTLGTAHNVTFVAPAHAPWPRRALLLKPAAGGFRLRLLPGMSGQLRCQGAPVDVAAVLATPAPRRWPRRPRVHRDVFLTTGDGGEVIVDAQTDLRLRLAFVDPPRTVPRFRRHDPLLFKCCFLTAAITLSALVLVLFFGDRVRTDPTLAISPERFARTFAPMAEPEPPAARMAAERAKAEAEERRRQKMEREAAEARRAREREGRLGRADATRRDTVVPKGREDLLREKVAKTGLLAVLGSSRNAGSGLGRLLTRTTSPDIDQALTGLVGAKLAVGQGAGGLGVAGTGLGGGGTSFGHIQGSGSLDVGAGRGRGRKGPSLGTGREKEVSVGVETGTPQAEGGLSKEQINRVVRAHAAAVKYCYEKELQRHPNLVGRVDLAWVIRGNGTVDRARVSSSTMDEREVEGCMVRQVKNWQFPKSDAETIVASYPFLFKGSG
jgi:hypothetical protein